MEAHRAAEDPFAPSPALRPSALGRELGTARRNLTLAQKRAVEMDGVFKARVAELEHKLATSALLIATMEEAHQRADASLIDRALAAENRAAIAEAALVDANRKVAQLADGFEQRVAAVERQQDEVRANLNRRVAEAETRAASAETALHDE